MWVKLVSEIWFMVKSESGQLTRDGGSWLIN